MKSILVSLLFFMAVSKVYGAEKVKEYPRFIGKYFNGLYYPRIDAIEWDNAPRTYYELHVYQKKEVPVPIDMGFAFKPETAGEKSKMLINYNIKNRGELLCRHLPIPDHFLKGGYKFFVDRSNPEYDNFMLTMDPDFLTKHMEKKNRKLQEVTLSEYKECKEELTQDDLPKQEDKKEDPKTDTKKPTESPVQKEEPETKKEDGGVDSTVW